jgi:hypothetical protein
MTIPNLLSLTQVYGKTTATNVGTAVTVLLSNSLASGRSVKLNSMYIANIDNTTNSRITVDFYRNSISIRLVDRMAIAPGDSLIAIDKNSSVYLEEGDSLRCYSDQVNLIHVTLSYEVSQ